MSTTVLSCTGSVVFSLDLRSFLVISPKGLSSGLFRLINALIRKVRTSAQRYACWFAHVFVFRKVCY